LHSIDHKIEVTLSAETGNIGDIEPVPGMEGDV
jgi:hypothetical protein